MSVWECWEADIIINNQSLGNSSWIIDGAFSQQNPTSLQAPSPEKNARDTLIYIIMTFTFHLNSLQVTYLPSAIFWTSRGHRYPPFNIYKQTRDRRRRTKMTRNFTRWMRSITTHLFAQVRICLTFFMFGFLSAGSGDCREKRGYYDKRSF